MIHADPHMKELHVDATDPFIIPAEFISLQDQLKILIIMGFTRNPFLRTPLPVIVTGSGYTGNGAQRFDRQAVIRTGNCLGYRLICS